MLTSRGFWRLPDVSDDQRNVFLGVAQPASTGFPQRASKIPEVAVEPQTLSFRKPPQRTTKAPTTHFWRTVVRASGVPAINFRRKGDWVLAGEQVYAAGTEEEEKVLLGGLWVYRERIYLDGEGKGENT